MPSKMLNIRQVRFCRAVAMGAIPTEAAIQAGYAEEWARNQAYRLMKDEHIADYIYILRFKFADKEAFDSRAMICKYQGLYDIAVKRGNIAGATRILELQQRLAAKLFPIPKTEWHPPKPPRGRTPSYRYTDAELREFLADPNEKTEGGEGWENDDK